ncbi:MAG: dihydrolipoamide acetyltransferase family protein [Nitrospiria bacterium]
MANRVVMPKLTDTMEEGVLLQWYKKEGDAVESGDPIAEVETDKAVMDLEAFASGTLKKILVPPGHIVPSGDLIALIARDDEDITALLKKETMPRTRKAGESGAPATPVQEKTEDKAAETSAPVPRNGAEEAKMQTEGTPDPSVSMGQMDSEIKASPLAKKIAAERHIDLSRIKGSGPGGRIIQRDLEGFDTLPLRPQAAAPLSEAERVELTQLRKAIAKRMSQSKAPVPHFYVTSEIDMGKVLPLRDALGKDGEEPKPSLSDLFIKGTALTLRKFPAFRSSYGGDHLKVSQTVDIGLAIGLPEGVITAVIRNCDQLTLSQISAEVKDKVARARVKKLKPEEYTGAVFSISNLGMYDVESFSAIITPPEAAVLAIGSIIEKPVVSNGEIAIGHIMKVTLSTDHRIADGLQAAEFLKVLKRTMENPLSLAM